MLYLTCTTIISVDLAHYGVSRAKDWVSVYCGTITFRRDAFLTEVCVALGTLRGTSSNFYQKDQKNYEA